jgi:hypothetical protein
MIYPALSVGTVIFVAQRLRSVLASAVLAGAAAVAFGVAFGIGYHGSFGFSPYEVLGLPALIVAIVQVGALGTAAFAFADRWRREVPRE